MCNVLYPRKILNLLYQIIIQRNIALHRAHYDNTINE